MKVSKGKRPRRGKAPKREEPRWSGPAVKALRAHLNVTQEELSQELGVRQQTVSEWETGQYHPRGSSAKMLSVIAEWAGFRYDGSAK